MLLVFGRAGALQADPLGIALCLAAGLTYALYTLLNKRLVDRSAPAVTTLGVFLVSALLALPAASPRRGSPTCCSPRACAASAPPAACRWP